MKAAQFRPWQGLGAAATLFLAASCTQMLGIDDAHIDPNLIPTGSGGAAGATGNVGGPGGSGGTTGSDAGAGGMGGDDGGTIARDSSTPSIDVTTDTGDSPICKDYCDNIMTDCGENLKQYVDMAQCLKVCSRFPEGAVGDPDANTAACRGKYASKAHYAAGTERAAYCRKAGPGSDGACGTICDGFCGLMMATCTPKYAPYNYPSIDACLTACRGLPDMPPYTVADGTLPDRADRQCRLFHVCSSVMDPDEHCEHSMGVTMCAGVDASP